MKCQLMIINLNASTDNAITCRFTTRQDGASPQPFASLNLGLHVGDNPKNVYTNREAVTDKLALGLSEIKTVNQVHGARIKVVDGGYPGSWASDFNELEKADGLITSEPGVYLSVFLADCRAVYIYDPVNTVIALLHCGWRSVHQNLIEATLNIMRDLFDSSPRNCRVWISPGLGRCCYEIKPDSFPISEQSWGAADIFQTMDGRHYFDLVRVIRQKLLSLNLLSDKITASDLCTSCDERFFSYRRDGRTGRMAAIMGINP